VIGSEAMSNISNLTSKIQKDAEDSKLSIIAAANGEKDKILSKRNNEAKTAATEIIEKAKIEAESRKERIISGAELQARNEKLKSKQVVIQEVFEKSVSELCNLEKIQYLAFIKESILALDIKGNEVLILNEIGLRFIDNSFIEQLNNELLSKGKIGNLTLRSIPANFKGGFILEKDGIEINNTFESLVHSLREELELEVAKQLFN
jgi:V/A-type H+-transporting ATPase subunit E